jgi:hypothetical protein
LTSFISEKFSNESLKPCDRFFSVKNKYKLCILPFVPALTSIGGGLTSSTTTAGGYRIYQFTAGTGTVTV